LIVLKIIYQIKIIFL